MGDTTTFLATRTVLAAALLLTGCDLLDKVSESEPDTKETKQPAADPDTAKGQAGGGDDGGGGAEAPTDDPTVSAATPAWNVDGPSQPLDMKVSPEGAIVAVFGDKMVGYVDGAEAWSKADAYTELVRLQDGTLLAAAGPNLVAFDPTTGTSTFETSIPAPEGFEETTRGKEQSLPGVVGAEAFGSQVLLAIADARFYVMDPPACVKKEPACLRPGGLLEGEYLEPAAVLKVADDGTRYLGEDDALRAFTLALEQRFDLSAHANIVGMTPVGNTRLALAFGGEIALLDTQRCAGRTEIRLARRGANIAPKGCVLWRYGGELDDVAPAVIDDSTLAANGNQRIQAVINGVDSWKSPLGAIGRVISGDDGLLYSMAVDEAEDGSMSVSVIAVDSTKGTVSWSVGLPFSIESGGVVIVDSLRMDWQSGWIAAALDNQIALLSIPGPSADASPAEESPAQPEGEGGSSGADPEAEGDAEAE